MKIKWTTMKVHSISNNNNSNNNNNNNKHKEVYKLVDYKWRGWKHNLL